MTIDMLTATVFWPEAAAAEAQMPRPSDPETTEDAALPDDQTAGFWSAVMRYFRRPASDTATIVPS